MSKGCTPHFNDVVAARGGKGATGNSAPGFMGTNSNEPIQRGQTGKQSPPKGGGGTTKAAGPTRPVNG